MIVIREYRARLVWGIVVLVLLTGVGVRTAWWRLLPEAYWAAARHTGKEIGTGRRK